MTTRLSQFNNTGLPLPIGATFTGLFERSLTGLEISTFVNCSGLSLVTIEQSVDASNVRITTTFNYDPVNDVSTFSVPIALPFFRVKLFNGDIVAQSYLTLNTYVINTPPQQVVIAGGTADVVVGGVVDVSGSVVATNLITETLAKRRVDFLVVGDYYRVASVGLTSGAQWNAIGAIVDGESVPVIGRLFKCLSIGPAVAGGGECFDVEYTDSVSATVTNFPAYPASVAVTVAQDLSCNILNFPATQAVTGTVSLTSPTTVRVADYYGSPITTTAGNTNVNINAISTATALHVIVDSVTPPTTAVAGALAVSTTGITLKASAGKLLTLHINSDGASGINYVKIYNEAVPTSASTPIFTIGVLFGSSQNVDCSSLNFATAIGVRCTNAAAAGDNTPASNAVNVTAFFV